MSSFDITPTSNAATLEVLEDLYNIDFDELSTYDDWIADDTLDVTDSSFGLNLAPNMSESEANEIHHAKPIQQNPKISHAIRKPNELGSFKNSRQGKTSESYMARQIKITSK